MRLPRRTVLLGLAAGIGVLGWQGTRLFGGSRLDRIVSHSLRQAYGRDIADGPVGITFQREFRVFVDQMLRGGQQHRAALMNQAFVHQGPIASDDWYAGFAVQHFALATNVCTYRETGDPLEFNALFDPQSGPCSNPLSFSAAP